MARKKQPASKSTTPNFYTVSQVAAMINRTRQYVSLLCQRGELKTVDYPGHDYLIIPESVEEFLRTKKTRKLAKDEE